jgi:hypothetical protein
LRISVVSDLSELGAFRRFSNLLQCGRFGWQVFDQNADTERNTLLADQRFWSKQSSGLLIVSAAKTAILFSFRIFIGHVEYLLYMLFS